MIADLIEVIGVEASGEGMFEALVQFEIENEKAERLRGADFGCGMRKAQRVRSLVLRAGQDPVAYGIYDVRFHKFVGAIAEELGKVRTQKSQSFGRDVKSALQSDRSGNSLGRSYCPRIGLSAIAPNLAQPGALATLILMDSLMPASE
jgi:hypothetical protein